MGWGGLTGVGLSITLMLKLKLYSSMKASHFQTPFNIPLCLSILQVSLGFGLFVGDFRPGNISGRTRTQASKIGPTVVDLFHLGCFKNPL